LTCWSCHGPTAPGAPSCGSCRKLQPIGPTEDAYSLFALPREFGLDRRDLERRYRDLSLHLHPDRFARAEPVERRLALQRATQLNDAFRALKDWRRRAAHLLGLAGLDVFGQARADDAAFLEEQLAVGEELALARLGGDAAALGGIATRARERLDALEAECGRLFGEQDWYGEPALEIARHLSRARYHEKIIADADRGAGSR